MRKTAKTDITVKNELITVKNGAPRVSHIVIAENTGNDKRSIARLIDNYSEEIRSFGKLRFEITPIKNAKNKVNEQKQFFLNEDQATFLMTLLKNNEVVVNFKLNLVKAFTKLKEEKKKEDIKKSNHLFNNPSPERVMENVAKWYMDSRFLKEYEKENKEMKKMLAKQENEIKELKANNNKHKALQTNIATLGQAEVLISVEEAGVKLGISRNQLFQKMRNRKFLKLNNEPYKRFKGEYFVQKKVKHLTKGGNWCNYNQTFVLPKGLELLKTTFA